MKGKTPQVARIVRESARVPSLDGLRAVAIFLVVLGHGLTSIPNRSPPIAPVAAGGHVGVQLFFTLSGYLITMLLLRERARRDTIDLAGFYLRRVLRIFPAAYAYLVVLGLLIHLGAIDVDWREVATAGLYVWNYYLSPSKWFLKHFWSLCLEEQFYLVWPAVLTFARRTSAASIAGAIILVMPVVRILTYFIWPAGRTHLMMMGHTAIDALMFGCLAAIWWDNPRFRAVLGLLFRWRAHVGALLFVVVLSPFLQERLRGPYCLTVGVALDSICCTLIVLWAIEHPGSVVGRILNSRPLVHLGTISYSLYIWQQLFLAAPGLNRAWPSPFPLNELYAVAAAEFSYWIIERPFLLLKDRISSRRAAGMATPVGVPPVWIGETLVSTSRAPAAEDRP